MTNETQDNGFEEWWDAECKRLSVCGWSSSTHIAQAAWLAATERMEGRVKELEAACKLRLRDYAQIHAELASVNMRNKDLENHRDQWHESCENWMGNYEDCKMELATANERIKKLERYTTEGTAGKMLEQIVTLTADLASLTAERDKLKDEVTELRRIVSMRALNLHTDGKTLLDFHVVWKEQQDDQIRKQEADLERLTKQRDGLLEALHGVIAKYDDTTHNEYDGTHMLEDMLAEIDFGRFAIAAAEGEKEC